MRGGREVKSKICHGFFDSLQTCANLLRLLHNNKEAIPCTEERPSDLPGSEQQSSSSSGEDPAYLEADRHILPSYGTLTCNTDMHV